VFNIIKLYEGVHYTTRKKLQEIFHRPDFSWISKMVDQVYANPENYEEITKRFKVNFEISEENSVLLITNASYDMQEDFYNFWLSPRAIENIDSGKSEDLLNVEIESFFVHEETHRQQNQLNISKQPYLGDYDPDNFEMVKKHLSQYQEIPAYARCIAKDLMENGYKEVDISKLSNLKMTELSKLTIFTYKEIGGEVWKSFLKEVFNYFSEPSVGGNLAYESWLKKNTENKKRDN